MDGHRKALNILRLVLLAIAFGSAIAVVAIISTLKGKFDGYCIILTDVKESSGKVYVFEVDDNPKSCSFLIKYQASACAVSCVCFIYLIFILYTQRVLYRVLIPLKAVVSAVYALLGFISACILHGALSKFCNDLEEYNETCKHFVWFHDMENKSVINSTPELFHSAQVTSWISFISWSILCITYVIQMRCTKPPQRFDENVVPPNTNRVEIIQ